MSQGTSTAHFIEGQVVARYLLAFHQVWLIDSWNPWIYLGGQRHCWYRTDITGQGSKLELFLKSNSLTARQSNLY